MKKYLALAAFLGAIAFVSVSYLAQADEHAVAAPAVQADAAAPASFEQNHDMCGMMAAAPTTEGVAPSDEEKSASYTKCMMGKGHTEEELKKAAADAAAKAEAPAHDAPAHEAPAAH